MSEEKEKRLPIYRYCRRCDKIVYMGEVCPRLNFDQYKKAIAYRTKLHNQSDKYLGE